MREIQMIHKKVDLDIALPATVEQDGVYWKIIDANGECYMGRKTEETIKELAWLLNNHDKLLTLWNHNDVSRKQSFQINDIIKPTEEVLRLSPSIACDFTNGVIVGFKRYADESLACAIVKQNSGIKKDISVQWIQKVD